MANIWKLESCRSTNNNLLIWKDHSGGLLAAVVVVVVVRRHSLRIRWAEKFKTIIIMNLEVISGGVNKINLSITDKFQIFLNHCVNQKMSKIYLFLLKMITCKTVLKI